MQGTVQGISLPGDMPPNCGPWGTATGTDHIDRSLDPGGKPGAAVIIPQSFTCGDCVGVKGGLGQNIMIPMVLELSVLSLCSTELEMWARNQIWPTGTLLCISLNHLVIKEGSSACSMHSFLAPFTLHCRGPCEGTIEGGHRVAV